jgi:hypothetical protein
MIRVRIEGARGGIRNPSKAVDKAVDRRKVIDRGQAEAPNGQPSS